MDSYHANLLADEALDVAEKLGATYADVRMYFDDKSESLEIKNDVVESIDRSSDSGVGVRVLKNGAWGFSSFPDTRQNVASCRKEMMRAVHEAINLAEASARLRSFPLELAPLTDVRVATYCTPFHVDPFLVPMAEKIDMLRLLCETLGQGNEKIVVRAAELSASGWTQFFASTQRGAPARCYLTQTFLSCGFDLLVLAQDGIETQERSFRNGMGSAAGFEFIYALDARALAERFAHEALELLDAPECEAGITDIILMPEQLGLHVHETGHGFEGDRLLGYEQTYVGGTFINEIVGDIGSYPFGSQAVNIVADATFPGGYGTFAFDDEGVPGNRFFLVEGGVIKNVLTSRETVEQINRRIGRSYYVASNGTMRASSYDRMPLIRMTNISLLPGDETLEGLVSRVDRGLLLDGTKSWSMSEDRKNFDFSVQYAREIHNGHLGRIVRNVGYTGNNLAFWKSCEAVACESEAYMLNIPDCGKGMPGQTMSTGHRSAPALFRGVEVYNRKQRGGF